jgi:hypothetical protein
MWLSSAAALIAAVGSAVGLPAADRIYGQETAALTGLPILVTPLVANASGHDADWAVMVPVGIMFAATLIVLWRTLRSASVILGPDPGDIP